MRNTYEENVALWKKAYTELLKAGEKYQDFDNLYSFYDIRDIVINAKSHLMLIEWYEKYGLRISHEYKPAQGNYFKTSSYVVFNKFDDAEADKAAGSGKYISWSDDGRQPNNEWLLEISFPTGAYIFGDDYDYQQKLFQDFINELKSFNPDYSDTNNKSFYWKLDNAKSIYEEFKNILDKYKNLNREQFNSRKAAKLREELRKLEESK